MYVEADFLGGSRPVLIAKAVLVFAIGVSIEGVIARGHGSFVTKVMALGVLDLSQEEGCQRN